MSAINDGGSAFPREQGTGDHYAREAGMSLRDYFAAHAPMRPIDWNQGQSGIDIDAIRAYRWADAMLAARAPR